MDVLTVIEGVLDAEEDAIETYRSLVQAAEEADACRPECAAPVFDGLRPSFD